MLASEMIARAREIRERLKNPPNAWRPPVTQKILIEPITSKNDAMRIVVDFVSTKLQVSIPDILGKSRFKHIVRARHLVCYLASDCLNLRLNFVGRFLGRDHTSVMHGRNITSLMLLTDSECLAAAEEFIDLYKPAFAIPAIDQQDLASGGQQNPYQRRVRKMENGRWRTVVVPEGLPASKAHQRQLSFIHTSDETG